VFYPGPWHQEASSEVVAESLGPLLALLDCQMAGQVVDRSEGCDETVVRRWYLSGSPMAERESRTDDDVPTLGALTAQLRALMTKGLPSVRPDDVEPLLALHAVRVLALVDLPSARLAALRERILELTRGTRDELLRRLAPYAFGTYSVESFPLGTRLEHAAASGIGQGTVSLRQKYLGLLASNFAERLLWLEYRLRHNRWLERPRADELHDETLRQYDFYTAMAFWLNGVGLDAEAALSSRPDDTLFHGYCQSALWRWVKFLRYSHRYSIEFLGEWAFAASTEIDVDEAVRLCNDAEALPPLTPRRRSWLRVELLTVLQEELDPFISTLERQPQGREILQAWTGWLAAGRQDDTVSRFLEATDSFFEIMNAAISAGHQTDRAARFRTLPDILEPPS
jgi:hypothetical protein